MKCLSGCCSAMPASDSRAWLGACPAESQMMYLQDFIDCPLFDIPVVHNLACEAESGVASALRKEQSMNSCRGVIRGSV